MLIREISEEYKEKPFPDSLYFKFIIIAHRAKDLS